MQRVCLMCCAQIAQPNSEECLDCIRKDAAYTEWVTNAPIEEVEAGLRADGIDPDTLAPRMIANLKRQQAEYSKQGLSRIGVDKLIELLEKKNSAGREGK